ncbi:MAG TPA: transglutaminase domain-containing protein [Flavisolibacter sp.]|nr:transglutaminase domain-containing protein [Flavisolibacter sp.]
MRIVSIVLLCVITQNSLGQSTSPFEKFGKITLEELEKKIYPIDSNANAIVLSDIGDAAVEGNSKGWFSISFTRHRVVHILNKSAYFEADVEVPLYTSNGGEEKLESVKAVTYNLENGKIVETKLDKASIFKERKDDHWIVKKFTLPNVKEGCIVEYEYKVVSDFIWNLDPWLFQGKSPELWSEFRLSVPQFFTYAFLGHGYHPMSINERKDRTSSFMVIDSRGTGATDRASFTAGVSDYRWVMKDVPEIKQESFTTALKNHLSGIEFQLASQGYPLTPHEYRSTWTGLAKELSESEYFGSGLKKDNNWLSDDVKPLLAGATTDVEKATRIFNFVRDNFSCTDHSALQVSQSLKNIFKSKKGSVSDINLLLTAMLRYAGFTADPVILSTSDHGYVRAEYPMITNFNYVVTQVLIGDRPYYLDASHERLGFGKMLPECYNGNARIVNETATPLQFSADSLSERKVTALFISVDEKGNWIGSMKQTPGYYESYMIRERVKEKGEQEFFKGIEKDFLTDVKISSPKIDSLTNYDYPVSLHYDLAFEPAKEDLIYISPLFGEATKNNPFKSAERYYPVEMPYTMDETYLLTFQVPAGYVVDELPKQIVAKMDEQESAMFEYRLSQSENTISLRSRIRVNRTLFLPEEYPMLREFFNVIVKKQAEQIVLKKKK